jgi:hypothetical protein
MDLWLRMTFHGAKIRQTGVNQMPRPKGKKPTVRLSVSVNPTDHAELARIAEARDLSIAWVVRRAIADYVERHRDDAQGELAMPRGRGL